jgi:hypothetical protein
VELEVGLTVSASSNMRGRMLIGVSVEGLSCKIVTGIVEFVVSSLWLMDFFLNAVQRAD